MPWRLFQTITKSTFWTKLTHWEFWPFEVVYSPIFFYWIWLSIKARSFFFFSASNPGIEYGGMLGESKFKVHQSLPQELTPITLLVNSSTTFSEIKELMAKYGLDYPIILKPDIGERGWMVEKILNDKGLKEYLDTICVDFLVQEYLDLPVELGVFYYRYPHKKNGKVSSIVKKKMLEVTGNGIHTVKELMESYPRANIQLKEFRIKYPKLLSEIPLKGDKIELMPIGNHCRGTTFLNANYLINDRLVKIFDEISRRINGFYFGRFDIRCASEQDLYDGNFKIMELNGAGAEPGHIYQPGNSLIAAYRSIISHLNALLDISRENKKRGFAYMSFREGMNFIRRVRKYNKMRSNAQEI